MRFSPNSSSVQNNPSYWWKEADACFTMVRMLLDKDSMPARQTVCDKCHGMLERAAKAILAEKGILTDDKSHNIRRLLMQSGEFDRLSLYQKGFISEISNLHVVATYPDEVKEARIWYDDESYQAIVLNCLAIYRELVKRKGSYGQGGSNEGN